MGALSGPIRKYGRIRVPYGGLLGVALLAVYHSGYASVARLDETALRPSRYVTIFTNRTT